MYIKRGILSLAAVLALSNAATADERATYLPLASDSADSMWILYGVNGFSDGIPTQDAGPTNFSSGLSGLEDNPTNDDLATAGLNGWGSLQALKDSEISISTLKIGVAVSGTPDPTEAVRSMYIKVADSTLSAPNVKFNYKATLEGQTLEILLNGKLYTTIISQDATWANPAVAVSGVSDTVPAGRDKIAEVLDFDFTNNPVAPSLFDKDVHLDTTGQTASFYHFNAITRQWEVYQKGAPAEAQDFIKFEVGKAYWGRVDKSDQLGSLTNDTDGSGGLVLGKSSQVNGLPDPNRYKDENNVSMLTSGWNMISFDETKPYIRHAATGLVLGGVTNSDEEFKVTDASGLNSIELDAFTDGGSENDAIAANKQIESARLRGVLPESFHIKFYRGENDGDIIIFSDAKFSITQTGGTAVTDVKTLYEADPYVGGTRTAITDLTAKVATSVYGEYAEVAEVLTGSTSADELGSATGGFAQIIYSDADGDTPTANRTITTSGNSDLNTAETQIEAMGVTTHPKVTQIDTDFDGTADKFIIASTKPFNIKDTTYIRTFEYTTATANGTLHVDLAGGTDVTVTNGDSTDDVATALDGVTDIVADDNGNIINVATIKSNTFDVKDDLTNDYLKKATDSSNSVTKGAIGGVYSLDNMARLAVNQVTVVVDKFTVASGGTYILGDSDDDWTINLNSLGAVGPASDQGIVTNYGDLKNMLDAMVAKINEQIKSNNLHAFASHDFSFAAAGVDATTDLPVAGTVLPYKITVTGVDVVSLAIDLVNDTGTADEVDPTSEAATGDNKVTLGSGDIVADLKTNPAYSPNYAIYGPLYTLREAGYDARAILKGTTEMVSNNGNIAWDSIDLTRPENEWFANNEYNLFNINHNSGYWVYLEPKTAESVVVSPFATFSGAYTYYFSNTLDSTNTVYPTNNIINNGQIQVTITGLNDVVAGSAYAIVGGEEVPLTRNGTTDTFTANISDYALQSFAEGGVVDVKIRAVNGKGEEDAVTAAVQIDYLKPSNLSITASSPKDLTLDADGATKYYIFKDTIPELKSTRDSRMGTEIFSSDVISSDSYTSVYNACSKYNFAELTTLRIVGADGEIDKANLSDAKEVVYASTLKGATLLAHDPSSSLLKDSNGDIYNDNCELVSQDNNDSGVSIKSLDPSNVLVARMSYIALPNSAFDQGSSSWTSEYKIPSNSSSAVIEIQNTPEYAGKEFIVEYNGKLYKSNFPSNKNNADASIINPIDLEATSFNSINQSLH